jgi:hypothetical protein
VSEEEDRAALSEIFFTPRKAERQQDSRETVPSEKPQGLDEAALLKFSIWPVKGGFTLRGGPGLKAEDLPLALSVLTAYEIRSGNPFKKYNPCDYRLEEPPMQIAHNGVSDTRGGRFGAGVRQRFMLNAFFLSGFDSKLRGENFCPRKAADAATGFRPSVAA